MTLPAPPWRPGPPRRTRPAKAPLTREQIVRAGLRLVTTEGIDAVSMRRLAAEFDTGPSSLYAHVANKDELLQLMFDEICADVPIPVPDPERWPEQIKDLCRAGYAAMVAHGDIARAALATIPTGPNAMRVSEAMLGIMLAGGVPPLIASIALDRMFLYIVADAYESSLYRDRIGSSEAEVAAYFKVMTDQLVTYYQALPADQYPNLREHARALVDGDGRRRFEFGLDMLVDGLDKYVVAGDSGREKSGPIGQ
jgi:AcrR family transcriptional regulator